MYVVRTINTLRLAPGMQVLEEWTTSWVCSVCSFPMHNPPDLVFLQGKCFVYFGRPPTVYKQIQVLALVAWIMNTLNLLQDVHPQRWLLKPSETFVELFDIMYIMVHRKLSCSNHPTHRKPSILVLAIQE
jgi:hypothetical protein